MMSDTLDSESASVHPDNSNHVVYRKCEPNAYSRSHHIHKDVSYRRYPILAEQLIKLDTERTPRSEKQCQKNASVIALGKTPNRQIANRNESKDIERRFYQNACIEIIVFKVN